MPSTTLERQQLILRWFGDLDTWGPERTLVAQGFYVSRGGIITTPTKSHSMTWEQSELLAFLIEEWDYGFDRGVDR